MRTESSQPSKTVQPVALPLGPGRIAASLLVGAVVFFCRAWLIETWGSPVPYWDQWDAEALTLYRKFLLDTLTWSDLFAAHNEHRIVLTRLADLGLLLGLGRWSPWGQMLLNAGLHAATAALIVASLARPLTPRAQAVFSLVTAVLFSLPAGWQNALWGFQSQVSFASLLAMMAFIGVANSPPLARNWWLGCAAAASALLANAGGIIVSLTVPFAQQRQASLRRWLAGLAVVSTIILLGLAWRTEVEAHAPLRAHSFQQFTAVLLHTLAWPHISAPAWTAILWLPLATWFTVRFSRGEIDTADRLAVALMVWTFLHAAAVAWTRGGGLIDAQPLSRYQDPLLLGSTAQLYGALQLANRFARTGRLMTLGWAGAFAAGLLSLTTVNLSEHLPYKRARDRVDLNRIRLYLAAGDPAVLVGTATHPGPHPDSRVIQRVLDDPVLRPILPLEFFTNNQDHRPFIIRHSAALTGFSGLILVATVVFTARGRSGSSQSQPRCVSEVGATAGAAEPPAEV